MTDAGHSEAAAQFVEAFTAAWANPTTERITALLAPQIRLVAPLTPTTEGIDAARDGFDRLFAMLPDLHGSVHGWRGDERLLFIDFSLSAKFGWRTVSWPAIDRFKLRDGVAIERTSYFNPMPVALGFATWPPLWPRLLGALRGG